MAIPITSFEEADGIGKHMISDEMPGDGCRSPQSLGGSTVGIFPYVDSVGNVFQQATPAGAKVDMPLAGQF